MFLDGEEEPDEKTRKLAWLEKTAEGLRQRAQPFAGRSEAGSHNLLCNQSNVFPFGVRSILSPRMILEEISDHFDLRAPFNSEAVEIGSSSCSASKMTLTKNLVNDQEALKSLRICQRRASSFLREILTA